MYLKNTQEGKSREYRDVIVFEQLRFQNVFLPSLKRKDGVLNFLRFKSVLQLRFRDGLAWTVDLTAFSHFFGVACISKLLYFSFFLADPDFPEAIGILGVGVETFVFCSSSCIRSLNDWTGTGSLFNILLKTNKQRKKNNGLAEKTARQPS